MSDVMVDTNILVFALSKPTPKEPPQRDVMRRSSVDLLQSLRSKLVQVSAVSWFELERRATDAERKALQRAVPRLRVIEFTNPYAERAASLLSAKNGTEKVCAHCLNPQKVQPCKECGATIAVAQKLCDSMIVGTAEECSTVTTLYSLDRGVLAFDRFVSKVKILQPPHPDGSVFDPILR